MTNERPADLDDDQLDVQTEARRRRVRAIWQAARDAERRLRHAEPYVYPADGPRDV